MEGSRFGRSMIALKTNGWKFVPLSLITSNLARTQK